MAPLPHFCSFTKVLLVLCLVFVSFTLSFIPAHSEVNNVRSRRMLELDNESKPNKKKTTTTSTSLSPSKNQTKLFKSTTTASKNQTKQIKTPFSSFGSSKNQTKLSKPKLSLSDSQTKNKTKPSSNPSTTITKSDKLTFKSQLQKKLNPTPSKSSNTIKITSSTTKKSSDLTKINSTSSPKNKTTKATKPQVEKSLNESKSKTNKTAKTTKPQVEKDTTNESKSKTPLSKNQPTINKKAKTQQTTQKNSQYSWLEDAEDDLISGFRDLPSKIQETLLPDLERISKTSKVYLNKANKEITKNFKPYVGNKYAPTIASIISFAFILIPIILVSLIFNKIKAYFSLQRLLIFIQVYLSIYFSILCLSSLITGLEPLKFFYATAQSTYICLQVLQTLAYVLYLLMLLMYLILVFSTETGPTTKLIGLAQTIVGFAVGLHYYMTVFHRAVLHQPPKTSWRVHAIYATFFLVICLSSSADRRKKAYLVEGGEVEKKS
ncbi:hypothetical protein K7X08_022152 [Anisodus acutangulus]|uniref:Uncharacterized protein n=1 Tax=Anisodus acutangulus TaxID=402998 RepID=A0A9Q1L6V1_9SOLA|nr:hypothetical protein K7X08_022152 [Anisodus acutangulus]